MKPYSIGDIHYCNFRYIRLYRFQCNRQSNYQHNMRYMLFYNLLSMKRNSHPCMTQYK